jgi:hypothetical protein
MTEKNKHFDEDWDFQVTPKLSADLNALFEPEAGVPPEVDRAITDRAFRQFAALQSSQGKLWRGRLGLASRWHPFGCAQDRLASGKKQGQDALATHWAWRIAAAAAVVILAFSLDLTKQAGPTKDRASLSKTQAVYIDPNGRVDILDAFKLARHIETAGRTETEWDINGDGLIDRSDVDIVAHAAVRLDKGV